MQQLRSPYASYLTTSCTSMYHILDSLLLFLCPPYPSFTLVGTASYYTFVHQILDSLMLCMPYHTLSLFPKNLDCLQPYAP